MKLHMVGAALIFGILVGSIIHIIVCRLGQQRINGSKVRCISLSVIMGMVSLFFYVRETLLQEWFFGVMYSAFLLEIALFDYDQGLILNKVLFLMAIVGVFANFFCLHLSWIEAFFSFFLDIGVLGFLCWVSHGGIGGGDIKFIGVLGIWLGWQASLLSLFLAFTSGAFTGVLLICLHRKQRQDHMVFGPFLAVAAFVSYLYGNEIVSFYEGAFL